MPKHDPHKALMHSIRKLIFEAKRDLANDKPKRKKR